MNALFNDHRLHLTRRRFFGRSASGVGVAALASILGRDSCVGAEPAPAADSKIPPPTGTMSEYHVPPKAKRVTYLFQSGAPSQQELFDYKPMLQKHETKDLRDYVDMNQRVTGMTAGQQTFPLPGHATSSPSMVSVAWNSVVSYCRTSPPSPTTCV